MRKKWALIALTTIGLAAAATPGQDGLFVNQLYSDVLGRSPNRLESYHWVTLLQRGGSRIQVAGALTSSQEYRKLLVDEVYKDYLSRSPAPDELSLWMSLLQQGGTDDQLRAQLLGSDEFYGRAGATNDLFLGALYQQVLGTPINPSAAAVLGQLLSQGTPRPTLANLLLTSVDGEQHKIAVWSERFLRTSADPAMLSNYSVALRSGATDEQIIDLILASDAYFSYATHSR